MAMLPGEDQPLLSGFLFGKQLAQEGQIQDAAHELAMKNIELSKWKAYAQSLEQLVNDMNADTKGVVATRNALVEEGLACNHPEHHKLSHDKGLRSQIYKKGYAETEPYIKEPRR